MGSPYTFENTFPTWERIRKQTQTEMEVTSSEVKKMLEQNIMQPSSSPWAAPVQLVSKKDAGVRFCMDYRKLNNQTKKDVYPLPRIDLILDALVKQP